MNVSQEERLPESFRHILWSYRFEDIDPQKNKQTIILQAINYGNLNHWKWVVAKYGKKEVRQTLMTVPVTSLRSHVRKLISLLFNINDQQYNHALRGTDRSGN